MYQYFIQCLKVEAWVVLNNNIVVLKSIYSFPCSAVMAVVPHVSRLVTELWIVGITNAHHSVTEVYEQTVLFYWIFF